MIQQQLTEWLSEAGTRAGEQGVRQRREEDCVERAEREGQPGSPRASRACAAESLHAPEVTKRPLRCSATDTKTACEVITALTQGTGDRTSGGRRVQGTRKRNGRASAARLRPPAAGRLPQASQPPCAPGAGPSMRPSKATKTLEFNPKSHT